MCSKSRLPILLSIFISLNLQAQAPTSQQRAQDTYLQQVVKEIQVKKYHLELEQCQKRLKEKTSHFEINLALTQQGTVQSINYTPNSARNQVFLTCVKNKSRKWHFTPAPPGTFSPTEIPSLSLGLPD